MESITIGTPALLFPAISLLLLAYTNRFLGLASVVRQLHRDYVADPKPVFLEQIDNLRRRIRLIRWMQLFGLLAIFLCTLSMFEILHGWDFLVGWTFQASLLLMLLSLWISIHEIWLSGGALDLNLRAMEELRAEKERQAGEK